MIRTTTMAAVALVTVLSGAARAQSTDGAVAEDLFRALMLPIEAALADAGAEGIVMVEPPANSKPLTALMGPIQERIGNFLYERGYEVHTVPLRGTRPEGVPVFDFEIDAAGFDYPSRRAGLLGLGKEKWLRRAAFGLQGRIEDPVSGHWLWKGAPRYVVEEWVSTGDVEDLADDRPAWMSERPLVVPEGRSPWWERSMMAGLLAGVVILYVDGTQ